MRSTIICVDDDKLILSTLSQQLNDWLKENYMIEKALSGQEALEIIDDCQSEGNDISLVISDYLMPGMKGDEFLEKVRQKTPGTRRIMLTGYSALEGITNAINKAGIYRYLSKPWDAKDMMLTVFQAIRSYEQDKRAEQLNERNKVLCGTLKKISDSLLINLKQTIRSFAATVELREGAISGHPERVAKYALLMAGELKMTEEHTRNLETAALLHNVGRLALNDADFQATKGLKCYTDKDAAALKADMAKHILGNMDLGIISGVRYHAERVDKGGAFGMGASDIPIEAKIIALCDYFDTIQTENNSSASEAIAAMKPYRNKIFDAALFDKFAKLGLE